MVGHLFPASLTAGISGLWCDKCNEGFLVGGISLPTKYLCSVTVVAAVLWRGGEFYYYYFYYYCGGFEPLKSSLVDPSSPTLA